MLFVSNEVFVQYELDPVYIIQYYRGLSQELSIGRTNFSGP
jgi:hypothetical protein